MNTQQEIDAAVGYLEKTTSSYAQMVKQHGADSSKWPVSSNWAKALNMLAEARAHSYVELEQDGLLELED